MSKFRFRFLPLVLFLGLVPPARAILFYSTGDPAYNTNAPTGTLTNSGWQYLGSWGSFLGTAIGPRHFVTAKHIGAQVGDPFVFRGVSYTTLAFHDDPASDLRLVRACGVLPPPYAPLYTNFNETSKSSVVFGRGTQRGAELRVTNVLKGWLWGPSDYVLRWGENRVVGPVPPGVTNLLQVNFDSTGGANEAHLSVGDSGGPLFIKEGTEWKLAAINYAVEGPYNTTTNGSGFNAAVFDEGGLHTYSQSTEMWVLTPDLPANLPGAFYSTRVSTGVPWIQSILSQPPPSEPPPVLQSAADVSAPFLDEPAATVNVPMRTITVPVAGPRRFFRLRACSVYRIQTITLNGGTVVMTYE